MNIWKDCVPGANGYYWYRTRGVEPVVARITEDDAQVEGEEAVKYVHFTGEDEPINNWELPTSYEFAGPIFPPTDWPINFGRWPE